MIRLNKFLAARADVSRREADRVIAEGKVTVNGKVVTEMGVQIDEFKDVIAYKGKHLNSKAKRLYYVFHKPKGFVTSYGDPEGRKNLNDFPFLAEHKLAYSGRLDSDSEGMIIFSNDGDLNYRLQRPEYKVEKEYRVMVSRELKEEEENEIRSGLRLGRERFKPCEIFHAGDNRYILIITEGKQRQVRRMFAKFGIRVRRLYRVRIGTVEIGDLEPGKLRKMNPLEIQELRQCTELE